MMAGLARMQDRARRYWASLCWMLRDAAAHFRVAMALALAASIIGVVVQGGVLGIVLVYARHLESGAVLKFAGWTLDPRTSLAFVMVGCVAAALLVLGAVLIYFAKRTIAALSVNYEVLCSRRVLAGYGLRPQERLPSQATRKILRALLREQSQHARACGRALMTVMNGAYPLVILLYMAAFLVVLNPETTLFLGLLASLFLYAHYRLNVQVAENEMQMKHVLPKFNVGIRQMMNAVLPLGRLHHDVDKRVAAAYDTGGVQEFFQRLQLRRVFAARADFLGNLLIGIATGGVVVYLGHLALSGVLTWGGCIAYIIALRVAVAGARSVLNGFAGYARWYPGVRAYRELVGHGAESTPPATPLVVRNRTGRGDVQEIALHAGAVGAILSPVDLTRFSLFHFSDSLLGAGNGAAWDFVPLQPRLPEGVTFRALLGGGADFEALVAGCDDAEFVAQLRALSGGDPDRTLDEEMLQRLDGAQTVKLTLLAFLRRPAQGVFIAAPAWAQLAAHDQPVWLRALSDRIVFIHHGKDVAAPGALGEKVVAIGSRAGQVALATCAWVQKRPQKILDRICVVPREHHVGFNLVQGGDEAELVEEN